MTHAIYSPSQLPRIINCPGSVEENLRIPDSNEESSYAREGTMLHKVVDEVLDIQDTKVSDDLSKKYSLNTEHIEAVQFCVDFVSDLGMEHNDEDSYYITESKVTLEALCEPTNCDYLRDVHGTLDMAYVFPSIRTLYIIDWKFGKGVEVLPDSDQLKAYAVGMLKTFKQAGLFDVVELVVVQPRLYSGMLIKKHTTTPAELSNWLLNRLVPALNEANMRNPRYNPSDEACRWCNSKMTCVARKKAKDAAAAKVFEVHAELPKVDIADLVAVLSMIPELKSYISDIETFAYNRLTSGEQVPGFKLVAGRSIRAWKNADEAEKYLLSVLPKESVYTRKLLSPAQSEKKLGAKGRKESAFQELIHKPEGSPTLVKESDKRPAIEFSTLEERFADYVEEE